MESRSAARSSLACTQCRNQHLKCDSVRPTCARCQTLSKPCSYPESRRSGKYRTSAWKAHRRTAMCHSPDPPTPSNTGSLQDGTLLRNTPLSNNSPILSTMSLLDSDVDNSLLELYYRYFHPSHPFVLPQKALQARIPATESPSLRQLTTVMQYVGSFYREPFLQSREYGGDVDCSMVDGFSVQATLLLALAKSMCDDRAGSSDLLVQAIAQATSIGMNTRDFAIATSGFDPVLAESWRRTWWMIYVVDANFAVIRWDFRQFLAGDAPDIDLPCDEDRYNRLEIPSTASSLADYQNREYAMQDQTYSSFAYFIDASCIYVSSLQASTQYENSSQAEIVCSDWEATIVSWFLMLPPHLRELPVTPALTDQLMFYAHMMMYTSLAFIHRPLSSLHYDAAEDHSSCRPPPPPLDAGASVGNAIKHRIHSEKLLQAIRKQNQCLILLPMRAVELSPFIICAIACCTIAHLVACKFAFDDKETQAARSRIRVTLGTLKHYEYIWPRARRILAELKQIANDMLHTKTLCAPSPTSNVVFSAEDTMLVSMLDEELMCAFETT